MLLSMTHLAYLMRIFLSFVPNYTVCLFQTSNSLIVNKKERRLKKKKAKQDQIVKSLPPSLNL